MVDERFPGGDGRAPDPERTAAMDETRIDPGLDAAGSGETGGEETGGEESGGEESGPGGGPAPGPTDDATSALPVPGAAAAGGVGRSGGAAAAGAAGDGAGGTPPPPRWSARAHVPPPGARPDAGEWGEDGGYPHTESYPADRYAADPYGGRSWFTPVAVALVVLVLLAMLGVGAYLIYRAAQGGGGEPSPTATASPSTAPTPSSAPPSAAPSTAPATSAAPVPVPVPTLIGLTETAARQQLGALKLGVKVVNRPDASAPPGTVIETVPVAGTLVNPGTEVTIVVAVAPPPPPPSGSSSSPTANGG
jgi:hypothetical protein